MSFTMNHEDMSSIAGHVSISKEKIGVVNLPLLNNPLHHLVLTAYHRCVAHNIIMMMVKFDCSGPATNHLQNLIDAVGINLFTVLIMTLKAYKSSFGYI